MGVVGLFTCLSGVRFAFSQVSLEKVARRMRMKSDDGEEQFLPNLRRFLRIDDNQNEIPLTQVRTIEGCLHHPSRSSLSLLHSVDRLPVVRRELSVQP